MMETAVALYKRTGTANLSQSEPRMTSEWDGFKGGQLFEVPLHDNNLQYDTVSTGLVKVQTDRFPEAFVNWTNSFTNEDRNLPNFTYPGNSVPGGHGCPLSLGANRTYYLGEVGDYFLETQGATIVTACDNFNVKMEVSLHTSGFASPAWICVDACTKHLFAGECY